MTRPAERSVHSWRAWHGYAPLDASFPVQLRAAAADLVEGLRRWRLWCFLATETVKNQYRRTVLGPWWLTIQSAAVVAGLAVLFGSIFKRPIEDFLPYVSTGYLLFVFLAGLVRRSADVMLDARDGITSNRQPLSALVLRAVVTEALLFAHNVVILVALGALGLLAVGWNLLLVVPVLALVLVNGVALGLWLGPLVARFRDLQPLIGSVLQMLIFFTPIFWRLDDVTDQVRTAIVIWNPFAHAVEAFRGALIGAPLAMDLAALGLVTGVNVVLAVIVFARTRSRLPYWIS